MRSAAFPAVLLPVLLHGQDRPLCSFENDAQMSIVVPRDTRIRTVERGATDGALALEIEFAKAPWPALFLRPAVPWDMSADGEIALDVTNPGALAVRFSVRVDDDYRSDGVGTSRTGSAILEPGATVTFSFPLRAQDPMAHGMRGLPFWPGSRSLGSNGTHILNLARICQMQVFLSSPAEPVTLIVDNVRTRPAPPLSGFIDEWGQFAWDDWPGKLHGEGEFAARREAEERELAESPQVSGRDRWGGWEEGPRLEATGYFRAAKHDGKWWLVTPEGTLFWSSGPNGVRWAVPTFVERREEMFAWLPASEDPLSRHYSRQTASRGPLAAGRAFDFHAANLERKYGYPFAERWRDLALKRLRSWGFNTVANWSETALRTGEVPYVTTTTLSGSYNTVASSTDPSQRIPDPFDERFAPAVAVRLAAAIGPHVSDPWCLGHFVDNELPWGASTSDATRTTVPFGVLAQKAEASPAKRAFLAQLQQGYASVEALNQAWGTTLARWEDLAPPARFNDAIRADCARFLLAYARLYFSTVRTELRRLDPNHLYLGSRFHVFSDPVIEAAAGHLDVITFNVYQRSIDPARWAFLATIDRPALVGEFHFGALDRGMFHPGLQAAANQQERAALFAAYLESALAHPSFVGAHWFTYVDQPATGRPLDGENYNIGLLTVTDTLYPEMIEAARGFHAAMYARRLAR
jgi:hypothetical protein